MPSVYFSLILEAAQFPIPGLQAEINQSYKSLEIYNSCYCVPTCQKGFETLVPYRCNCWSFDKNVTFHPGKQIKILVPQTMFTLLYKQPKNDYVLAVLSHFDLTANFWTMYNGCIKFCFMVVGHYILNKTSGSSWNNDPIKSWF